MPVPLLPLAAYGVSTAASLLAKRKKPRLKYRPFSFNFDENDPELAQARSEVLRGEQRRGMDLTNEAARAGILGSDQYFSQQREVGSETERELMAALAGAYGRQKSQAHEDYLTELGIDRTNFGLDVEDYNRGEASRAGALQGLGEIGGGALQDWWRKSNLYGGSQPYFSKDFLDSNVYRDEIVPMIRKLREESYTPPSARSVRY